MMTLARPDSPEHWLSAIAPNSVPALWQLLLPWMPAGIDLSLERTVFAGGALTLEFGDGSYDLEPLLRQS